ncbi:hypothetical protein JAAARDRAFT_152717 [Jaapia argillacea MUCL 33604]|uniref:Enoyl reductase (ER) domain-containing protein n=1 Tax=Jaapia argillacea MUCL 33604 TaxID=933084 RepID=A0A067PZM6_9AGAM|nr:hypothetical protein JAAARDRAFT_152717 [Jaapia argillacea MUCL 33604]
MEGTMKALYYQAAEQFDVRRVPIPKINDDQVLVKVSYCGVCGTDAHVHVGEFGAKFPLIPGHEITGTIVSIGKHVEDFAVGDRCVADPGILCEKCSYCRRGQHVLCENFKGAGVHVNGGFAEYIAFDAKKVYAIHNLTDEEAVMVEPAACAIHGMDKLSPPVGVEVLIIGAGPTGLVLAQLLKLNGAAKVVVVANKGPKMDLARSLDAGDEFVELDRNDPSSQWEEIKKKNPHGFDVVVEATGSQKIANDSIDYVRRGGTLLIYGVYDESAFVHWKPSRIFADEIKIIGSFAQTHCFPRAVAYLESGKIKVKGIVTDVFGLEEYGKVLEKMRNREAVKIAIRP